MSIFRNKTKGGAKKRTTNKPKREAKNEFRYNYKTKHTNYIFEKEDDKYHSLGLTHHKKTFGKENMPLSKNTKKNDEKKSYIRSGVITEKTNNFSSIDKRHTFSNEDKTNVKAKIRNYKKNRKR